MRHRYTRTSGLWSILLSSGCLWGEAALAISVGPAGDSSLGTFECGATTLGDLCTISETIDWDPTAGPWQKSLTPTQNNFRIRFIETITIGGTESWTDWHEELDAASTQFPEWVWDPSTIGTFVTGIFVGGVAVPGLSVSTSPNNKIIEFFFDPIAPGATIEIQKQLFCPATNAATCFGPGMPPTPVLIVNEFPTIPIPAAAWLFASALGLLGWMRRRSA